MQREMRRKDRLVSSKEQQIEIINKCEICRLAMIDEDGAPYLVPLNFGYDWSGEELKLYFHCAKQGRKVDILKKNNKVCFEMDCGHELVINNAESTYMYESIIGDGEAEFIEDIDEKMKAMNILMKHLAKGKDFTFTKEQIGAVEMICVTAKELKGKKH